MWRLPYAFALNHTVEEILDMCKSAEQDHERLLWLQQKVLERLSLREGELTQDWFLPDKLTLEEFLDRSESVFIGLHGGFGEGGDFQAVLEERRIPFNGPWLKGFKAMYG